MSYAHGTPFLNLAQTVGTDHRDWFDENDAKLDLDTKMKTLWDGAASTADILEQLQETISGLDTDLASLTTVVDGHTTTLQTVNESLVLINSALTALNNDVHTKFDSAGIADPYDPTYGIYEIGDVVTYNGQRYKCVTAVTAAEPFDADKWLAEDIQTVIDGLNNDLAKWHFVIRTKTTNANGLIDFGDLNGIMAQHDVYNVTANIVSPHHYTCTNPCCVISDQDPTRANWYSRVEQENDKTAVANTEVTVRLSWYQV